MTHSSIDQVPHSNPDDNEGRMRPQDHPESIQSGSQDFFVHETPANQYREPQPLDRDPDEKHKTKRAVAIAAGSLVLATGAFFGFKAAVNDTAEKIAADRASTSAPAFPGQGYLEGDLDFDGVVTSEEYDQMDPKEYAKKVPERSRVQDVAGNLYKYMPGSWDIMKQDNLNANERAVMSMPDLNAPRSEWTDQDYLNYYSIALGLISNQGSQQQQIAEGQRALSVVMSPQNNNFDSTMQSIATSNGIRNVFKAESSAYTGIELRPGTSIGEHTVTGEGGRLVLSTFVSQENSDKPSYMLFVNRSDQQGRIVSILAEVYSANAPQLAGISLSK